MPFASSSAAPDPNEGLRERKKRITRQELHEAALHLVLRDGLAQVTVEEICAEAGYAPRTFFNYFASKEAALIVEVDDGHAALAAELPARIGPGELIAEVYAALLRYVREHEPTVANVEAHHEVLDRYPEVLSLQLRAFDAAQRGLVAVLRERTELDTDWPQAEVTASMVTMLMRTAFSQWLRGNGTRPIHEYIQTTFETARELIIAVPRENPGSPS
ncbi:TetR family transcriptional regulator [Tamaricihabitans halophyticus]|uniref:TetR family transcriptional regulator n=1 Tax=Tamaricihabitans halophyticus TaxID=1262583 RepID=A0A4R2Q8H3_9PSEU|nr:TetR/AcrR family transcriptional regulator [Tamaricihabitans halophyticus]TCP45120.1 TetR family transcriptional regulator [Tamaricihabitans halophyticus]